MQSERGKWRERAQRIERGTWRAREGNGERVCRRGEWSRLGEGRRGGSGEGRRGGVGLQCDGYTVRQGHRVRTGSGSTDVYPLLEKQSMVGQSMVGQSMVGVSGMCENL